ncbi:MAG: RluA family pseudouridine synthase [Patescibacteria group bacterium]|mgnify:CR=1 FL=1
MQNKFTVKSEGNGERLDVWFANAAGLTRSQIQKNIKDDLVTINGVRPKKFGEIVHTGDIVVILAMAKRQESIIATQKSEIIIPEVKIIAETKEYLVIFKPAGLITHPGAHIVRKSEVSASGTLASWVIENYPKLWGVGEYENRPGIVHRLDKETSGLMVIAKTQKSFDSLKKQFQNRETEKKYYALAHGKIPVENGTLDFPIDRGVGGKMVSRPITKIVNLRNVNKILPGKVALTEFSVIKRFVNYTLLDLNLRTGRTHQIRVHLFAYNHSVVGDKLYFNKNLKRDKNLKLDRLFLHSYSLCFSDLKNEKQCFTSPMPEELEQYLKKLVPLV